MNLQGKVALITGGARGLGRAFSEALLSKGAKVCICDINSTDGEATQKVWRDRFGVGRTMYVQCDVTNKDSFTAVFEATKKTFGGVDIVVNNAGLGEMSFEDNWQKMVDVNLNGVIMGTNLAVQYMSKSNGGRGGLVLNIASTAGLTPVFWMPVYVASKFGVVGYTRSVAYNPSNGDMGMRFVCLCPAFTDTSMFQAGSSKNNTSMDADKVAKLREKLIGDTGINSIESVAGAFMELVENENNNGAVMAVSVKKGREYKHGKPVRKSKM